MPDTQKNIYFQQQNGINTDCSFVFDVHDDNGGTTKKIIHGHKKILSTASKYLEKIFKLVSWDKNQTIHVKICEYSIFKKLIKFIYLSDITFETIEETFELYKAANFYCIEDVLKLARHHMTEYCLSSEKISSIVNFAFKYNDKKLKEFLTDFFPYYASDTIMFNEDFPNICPDAINYFFQLDNLAIPENLLICILEWYVEDTEIEIEEIEPAIDAIRWLSITESQVESTFLLTDIKKEKILIEKVAYTEAQKKEPRFWVFNPNENDKN